MIASNGLMAAPLKKEKFNLALPGPLKAEFDALTRVYGEKKKGEIVSVATLLLVELSRDAIDYVREELAVAGIRGSFDALIARAKSGELRREAEARTRKPARGAAGRIIGVNPR